jgi:hypothetical protein
VTALVLAGAAVPDAGAAGPGSLVFTKGGKIWLANPDGSGQRRVTRKTRHPVRFAHATQADNGTIVALVGGTRLYRFARSGKQLGKPRRIASGLSNEGPLHQLAAAPEVSPNGKRVVLYQTLLQDTSGPNGTHGVTLLAVFVEYRSATNGRKLREVHEPGDYYQNPSWIDDNRILFFAPYNGFAPQVFTDQFGGSRQGWFADEFNGEDSFSRQLLDDGELARTGDRLALIKGTNVQGDSAGAVVQVYSVSSLSTPPTPACSFRPPGSGPFSGPSWSPDGSSVAWSDPSGVWVAAIDPAAPDCAAAPRLVAAGGKEPDWGVR